MQEQLRAKLTGLIFPNMLLTESADGNMHRLAIPLKLHKYMQIFQDAIGNDVIYLSVDGSDADGEFLHFASADGLNFIMQEADKLIDAHSTNMPKAYNVDNIREEIRNRLNGKHVPTRPRLIALLESGESVADFINGHCAYWLKRNADI